MKEILNRLAGGLACVGSKKRVRDRPLQVGKADPTLPPFYPSIGFDLRVGTFGLKARLLKKAAPMMATPISWVPTFGYIMNAEAIPMTHRATMLR